MAKKFHGTLELTLKNEEKINVSVHKNGSSIYLSDSIGTILVHPGNEKDVEGWVREYHICRGEVVKNHYFKPPWIK